MFSIVEHQLSSNSALYKHICLDNIKKTYKYDRNFDYQHQCKSKIEAAMVSTLRGIINNSIMTVGALGNVKYLIKRKLLSKILELLNSKKRTAVRILRATKSKYKAIRTDSALCR